MPEDGLRYPSPYGKGKEGPKGTGGVTVLPNGKADIDVKVRSWDGSVRRIRKRLPSEEQAERHVLKLRHEEAEGALLAEGADRLTVGAYLDAWLEDSVAGTVARHTERDYRDKVRLHIKPEIGRLRLAELTTQHLNRLYRKKLKSGLGAASVRYIHVTMSKALHEAEGADLVRKNVARWAKPPKQEHVEKPVLSVADAMLFLEAIRDVRMEALYLLAVTTGLRRGEMIGLKWEDLDLEKGTLRVSRSLDQHYGPAKENAPKRAASRRPAVLPAPVVGALGRRAAEQEAERLAGGKAWRGSPEGSGFVFTTRLGTPERGDNLLARSLKPLMEKAGLPRHNFQTLRRSNATFLVLLGVNPRVAMSWLGHSDVATTLKFYQQAPDELQEKAAELMGELLFGGGPDDENGL